MSDEDKLIVARARKIQKFLSQPMFVAEQFTGLEGKYVKMEDTIRGFKEIVEGKHDDLSGAGVLHGGHDRRGARKGREDGGQRVKLKVKGKKRTRKRCYRKTSNSTL